MEFAADTLTAHGISWQRRNCTERSHFPFPAFFPTGTSTSPTVRPGWSSSPSYSSCKRCKRKVKKNTLEPKTWNSATARETDQTLSPFQFFLHLSSKGHGKWRVSPLVSQARSPVHSHRVRLLLRRRVKRYQLRGTVRGAPPEDHPVQREALREEGGGRFSFYIIGE